MDPDTGLEIGVFRNTPAIRERLRTLIAPTPRQPLPSSPRPQRAEQQRSLSPNPRDDLVPSREYRSDLDETAFSQLEKSIPTERQSLDVQPLVYTISGKNKAQMKRRAEKDAKKRSMVHESRVAKATTTKARRIRQTQLSPARVVRDSENETVVGVLKELVDPWFRDFPLDKDGTLLTRITQVKIKRRAIAIAGPEVVEDWQAFMASWRENGFLTSRPTSRNQQLIPKNLQGLPVEIVDFYYAYNRVKTTEIADSFKAITHRFRMARLWMIYSKAEDVEL